MQAFQLREGEKIDFPPCSLRGCSLELEGKDSVYGVECMALITETKRSMHVKLVATLRYHPENDEEQKRIKILEHMVLEARPESTLPELREAVDEILGVEE